MARYFALALVCLAVLGGIGYYVRARMTPPAIAQRDAGVSRVIAPADAAMLRTVIVGVTGNVERRSGDTWVAVAIGDSLDAKDAIRTKEGAKARIDVGSKIVELDDRTEITVNEISTTVSSIVLAEGRVSANSAASSGEAARVIRIATRDSDAVAEATDGKFAVLAQGNGHVTVAAETGTVKVTAHGASVDVHAGEQSTVIAGTAPAPPTKIPSSLFLKVSAANAGPDRVEALRGETTPGAIVSINGVRTLAADTGAFETRVPLKQGANLIVVSVEDATGRREQKVIKRSIDAKGPRLDTQVEWK
jgi:hypothetical protein